MFPVDINLTDGPDLVGTGAIQVLNEINGGVSNPQLTIEVDVRAATQLEIAQNLDFDVGYRVIEATQLDKQCFSF